jgi:hypothetical protein
VDYLFGVLVEEVSVPEEPRDPSLEELCQKLVKETRVDTLAHFRRDYPLKCPVRGKTEETFEFSFAYGNGTPSRLYQQLPLPRKRYRKALTKNVHHIAWMFEKTIDARVIAPEQGGILVYPTEEQLHDGEVERSLKMLGSITRVLDLHAYEQVRSEFQGLEALEIAHSAKGTLWPGQGEAAP